MAISKKRLRTASLAVGQRIAALRRVAGLTQEQLAERVGSAKATISRLERGLERASLQRLMEIADALGTDVHDIFATVSMTDDPRGPEIAEVVALLRRASVEDMQRAVEVVRALLSK